MSLALIVPRPAISLRYDAAPIWLRHDETMLLPFEVHYDDDYLHMARARDPMFIYTLYKVFTLLKSI